MDSITQAAVGGAIGEACFGRTIGNKAVLLGVLVGSLPDFDVLRHPFISDVARLHWHRGVSHSLITACAAGVGFYLLALYRKNKAEQQKLEPIKGASPLRWGGFGFLAIASHTLIDCFTIYGTKIFSPFSDYRVGLGNLFLIDPFYTVPLLLGLGGAILAGRLQPRKRAFRNWTGIIVSSLYVLLSLSFQALAQDRMQSSLARQGVSWEDWLTVPTPFNILLWRGVAKSESGYWIGYRSVLTGLFRDDPPLSRFCYVPRNEELIGRLAGAQEVASLKWFSDGWYIVRPHQDGIRFSDIRSGERVIETLVPEFFVSWILSDQDGSLVVREQDILLDGYPGTIRQLWDSIVGRHDPAICQSE